jgi:hypothetical protein
MQKRRFLLANRPAQAYARSRRRKPNDTSKRKSCVRYHYSNQAWRFATPRNVKTHTASRQRGGSLYEAPRDQGRHAGADEDLRPQGEIHWNDGSGRIADLIDVSVTLIRLTNPNTGLVSIEMSLEYHITSDGARTPDGRPFPGATNSFDPGREDYNLYHNVYFRNSAGGLVYQWALDKDFALVCGWNRQHRLHGKTETNQLDWFDLVAQYQWEVGGAFYRC